MPQNSLSENPILSQNTPAILDVSRDALAKMVGVDSGDLPDGEFFRVIDGQIDNLRRVATAHSGSERREEMRKYLQSISDKETQSRIVDEAELAGKKLEDAIALGTETAARETIGNFATNIAKSGIEGIETLGALGSAKSVDEMTSSVDKLTQTSQNIAATYGTMTNLLGKSVSGLMNVTGLDKLFNALKKLFGFGSADSQGTSSSKPLEPSETKGSTPEISPTNTPETPSVNTPKKSPEKIAEDIGNHFWQQYVGSGWIKNPEAQKKAFFEVYTKYSPEFAKVLGTLYSNVQDTNKEWNIFDELVKYPLLTTKFLLALIARGVISEKAIMLNIYDAGRATLGVYLLSPFTLIQNGPSQVLQDLGAIDASQLGSLDTVEKQTMISILSHSMAPQLFLAGKLASSLAKVLLVGMYYDQGTGLTKAAASMDVFLGNIEKGVNHIDDILKMLGTNTRTSGLDAYTDSVRRLAQQSKEMALIFEAFRDGERVGHTPSQIASTVEGVLSQKGVQYAADSDMARLISQLKVAPSLTEAKLHTTSYFTNAGSTQGGFSRMVGDFRNMFTPMNTKSPRLDYFIDDARISLKKYGEGLSAVLLNHDNALFQLLKKRGLIKNQAELFDALERGHLPIKAANAEDARGVLQQIIKNVPKGLEHAFAGLTVVLTVAHVSQAPADQKAMTALLDTAAMWPVVGGLILMHEGFTLQGSQPVRLGYLAGGGLVTALGVREMTALVSRYGWAGGTGRALLTPATMVIDSIGAGVRGSQYLYQMARFGPRGTLGVLGASRGLTLAERVRPTGLLAMGALISFFVLNEIFEKQTRKILQSAGILKDDGSIDPQNLKEGWKKVPKEEQKKILDIVLASFEESDLNINYDSSENRIIVHTPKVVNGLPVPENLFDSLRKVFHDTGMNEPKIFLSENALATTRNYINTLPISSEQKKQLFAKFNITA